MNTYNILLKTDEILSDEARWTKRAYAKNHKGDACLIESPEAFSFCIVGAVILASRRVHSDEFRSFNEYIQTLSFLKKLIPQSFDGDISEFNDWDYTKFSDVKGLLKQAIDVAERI